MKIQEILSQYLYKEKSLTLPGLGRFDLNPSVNIYDLKEEGWPADTISFTTNRNAVLDESLLQFLMQQTGKMKPLAMSDLESYISNGMQLINIGKPFPIKGIGSINKTKDNQFTFEQGSPALEKIDSINTDHVRDRTVLAEGEKEIDFSHEERKSSKKPIIILGTIVALVLVGWAVYLAIPKKDKPQEPETNLTEQITPADTTTQQPDTTASVVKDSVAPVVPAPLVDTSSLKLILETAATKSKADARIAFHKTRGRELSLLMKDSSTYQLILLVQKSLSDSTKVKDSLRNWYGIKAQVVKPGN
ncbi:hypothetical protein [Lacibacter sediminis]|uniref:CCDC81-like prokaryotic HU domain-containing protein n=1 Tax=Lacibacter sediminis TaxID=2760713 RepID=A0A7G5XDH9_9BACT|nr:hypothetical protein [Lacibacter sediminis]QNA43532.1 hypothetical protein H4075_15800 [Lacibacter sediminis]